MDEDTFEINVKFDPLLHDATDSNNDRSNGEQKQQQLSMQTYTAGEDGSRLAKAAKELGLQQARLPRRQVRSVRRHSFRLNNPSDVVHLLLDSTTEELRMRAIYSSHADRLEAWIEEELAEGGGAGIDAHGEAIGGDLTSAILGIIKAMVGPAILYLPHGFASAGYVVALPIMMITTIMYLYSSTCLLQAWKLESQKDDESNGVDESTSLLSHRYKRRQMLSYPELAYRALGTSGESVIKTGIALMQSGVCLTYLIFVPQNLHTSIQILTGLDISPDFWLLVMIAIQIPLSWIRDIRKLTPTNLAANCCILYGLTICLYFAISQSLLHGSSSTTTTTTFNPLHNLWEHFTDLTPFASDWFLFIGTSVLLFEGSITLLVPLQEAVDSDEEREQFPSVYIRVILCIICFYAFFGITCWMAFGNTVRTVLTTSLPSGLLATSVQLAYSIAVIFTFPLQNFPALEITTRTILATNKCGNNTKPEKGIWTKRNLLSSILVGVLAIVAVCTMESLDKVVSLMGSLLGCPIAFVFPPLIHSYLDTNISTSRLWCNRIVASLGVGAMVIASIITLITWN